MNTTNEVTTTQEVKSQEGVWVEISRITVPEDARKHTPVDIDSRAISLAKDGQLENILLSKEGDQLVLVYGNGRLESAKKAGWEKIRADIKEGLTESQKLMMTLAENDEREDASPFYIASLYQRLMQNGTLDQAALAKELGKDPSSIAKYMALFDVSDSVRQNVNAFTLSLRQCLAIAKLTKVEDQLAVMKECATQDLSGKALEARVKQLLNPKPTGAGTPGSDPNVNKGSDPEPGPFQFLWKGNGLVIKGRTFTPHTESLQQYLNELSDAYDRFMEAEKEHAVSKAA